MEEEAHSFFIVTWKNAFHQSLRLQAKLNNSANHRGQIEMDSGETDFVFFVNKTDPF